MRVNKLISIGIVIVLALFTQFAQASSPNYFPRNSHNILYVPPGKGPFPAVLVLHASGGVEPVYNEWANFLTQQGYVVYIVDSFSSRGYKDRKSIGWDTATAAQQADIAPAYHYLAQQMYVDANRIGLLGFSMGGYDALRARQIKGEGSIPALNTLPFKATASFYGNCSRFSSNTVIKGPVKIFIGQQDDRATIAACETLVSNNKKQGQATFITVYPQAYHGFDNPAFPAKKELTDEKGAIYHVGYNKAAQEAAHKDLLQFFNRYL